MAANPNVNQAAAVIFTSLAAARAARVPENRIVHIWGGASASEADNYLKRDRYDRSTAQAAVLRRAVELGGGSAERFGKLELYSCFPVVPKMALRELGLDPAKHSPTITGGLTFFGGPLNNYMSHVICAMVRALREAPDELGLLYGQGGYVYKHHALVVSVRPPAAPMKLDYSVQDAADAARGPAPALAEGFQGCARVETYTVLYGRDGTPLQGIVIARTQDEHRVMARVMPDDADSMQRLLSTKRSAIGSVGHVRIDTFGMPTWEAGDTPRDRRSRPRAS
ncbi:MAG: hypothetical protein ACT4PZ_19375 [Panacagrimonas sp.]